ncbi:MAG TPA: ACT domain-containing protein, partial [Candidatus Limnocylindrales bacterium]|nr:ACT domain-containing protein [Candidatus Limnocylindrales bacterium]
EIYSDVPGVFTADPRIVPEARKLDVVSYEEMLEMAASGAKVLMLRSVELARNHGVRIHARSTFSEEEGTWVLEAEGMEQPIVSAVTHSETDVVFTLTGIPDRPGVAAMIFDTVASAQVNVDTIIQNVVHGRAEMSFSVPVEDVPATRDALAAAQADLGAFDVGENHELGKVSLVGAGMRSHPGVSATFFEALAEAGVNVDMIVQNVGHGGETDLSFTVPRVELGKTKKTLEPVVRELGAREMTTDTSVAKVSIVGAGLHNAPGYAARMFGTLADAGVNIEMISTSEVRITCMIAEDELETALKALHRAFELERPEPVALDAAAAAGR